MSRFTDEKPRIATESDCIAKWNGGKNGEFFRCCLCGYRFQAGDYWRWVYNRCKTIEVDGKRLGVCNFLTCKDCDGDDVLDRWATMNKLAMTKFWWFWV